MPRVSYPCLAPACGKRVGKGIECDVCGRWAHPSCSGIPKEHYESYCANSWAEWVCRLCKDAAKAAYIGRMCETPTAPETSHSSMGVSQQPTVLERPQLSYLEAAKAGTQAKLPFLRRAMPKEQGARGITPPPMLCSTPRLEEKPLDRVEGKKNKPKRKNRAPKKAQEHKPIESQGQSLEQQLKDLKEQVLALGAQGKDSKPRNLLIRNNEEPFIREARARRDKDRRIVMDLMRLLANQYPIVVKRVHRVGVWKTPHPSRPSIARPLLVEFAESHQRDFVLSRAHQIATYTRGRFIIEPDRLMKPLPRPEFRGFGPLGQQRRNGLTHPLLPQGKPSNVGENHGVVIVEELMESDWVYPSQEDAVSNAVPALSVTPVRKQTTSEVDFETGGRRSVEAPTTLAKNGSTPRALRSRTKQD